MFLGLPIIGYDIEHFFFHFCNDQNQCIFELDSLIKWIISNMHFDSDASCILQSI